MPHWTGACQDKNGEKAFPPNYRLDADQARPWDLPTWRTEWRDHARAHLDHLGFFRLEEKPWVPHKWIPRMDAEVRVAWKQLYDAMTDGEYRAEFVKQVELRRRELVPFHVRVELLYL